jgi:hypothetical protein
VKVGDLVYVNDEAIVPSGTTLHGFPALVVSVPNEEDLIVLVDGMNILVSRRDCRIYGEEVTYG